MKSPKMSQNCFTWNSRVTIPMMTVVDSRAWTGSLIPSDKKSACSDKCDSTHEGIRGDTVLVHIKDNIAGIKTPKSIQKCVGKY